MVFLADELRGFVDWLKERAFTSVYSREELTRLKDKMLQFFGVRQMEKITHLYRVKKPNYWELIEREKAQIMENYGKDNTGHSASAINVSKMRGVTNLSANLLIKEHAHHLIVDIIQACSFAPRCFAGGLQRNHRTEHKR